MPRMTSTTGRGRAPVRKSARGGLQPVKIRIAGPSVDPAAQLDRLDSEEEKKEYSGFLTGVEHLVVLSKRFASRRAAVQKHLASLSGRRRSLRPPARGDQDFRDDNHPRRARRRVEVKKDDGVRAAPSTSGTDQDIDARSYDFVDDILDPPYPFDVIASLFENSGPLRRNVDAMAANIDAFGYTFTPVLDFSHPDVDDHIRDLIFLANVDEKHVDVSDLDEVEGKMDELEPELAEIKKKRRVWERVAMVEKHKLHAFFEALHPRFSFTRLRIQTRENLELFGNASWEILRERRDDVYSKIEQAYHVPFASMRLVRQDKSPTEVKVKVRKNAITWDELVFKRYFRRYVRLVGSTKTYYKEFGDPRVVSRASGRYYTTVEELWDEEGRSAQPANELLHFAIDSLISPYGIARWMGVLLPVLGNRASEEVNFLYFDNKAIPPMVLLVSGGRLSDSSVERLETVINERLKGRENFHKVLVIEGIPADAKESNNDTEPSGKLRLELKPLTSEMLQDGLFQTYDTANELKIGRAFRQPPLLTGDQRDANRSCYSEDTETLTEGGWKLVDDIGPGEKIAAYDPRTNRLEFVVPTAKLVYKVENEKLYHFHGKHTDSLVTWDHRMLVRYHGSPGEAGKRWRVDVAQTVAEMNAFAFRVAPDEGGWKGLPLTKDVVQKADGLYFQLPKICSNERADGHHHGDADLVRLEDWLEFLGYWISEGSLLQTDSPGSPYVVTLCQKKEPQREKFQALLDRLPWNASRSDAGGDGVTRWHINNKCLREWLVENCGDPATGSTKSGVKRLPQSYTLLEPRLMRILYEAMMDGDGSRMARRRVGDGPKKWRNSRQYYTTSETLADQVLQIGLLLGMRSVKRRGDRIWRISQLDAVDTQMARAKNVEVVPYTGRVYCFSVPTHGFFVTRRNGKPAIQGNTADTVKAIAEEQVYQPARDLFDSDMDRLFLSNLGVRFWHFRSQAPVTRFPNDLVENATKSMLRGAITPNECRALLSDAFSKDFPHRSEDWADTPPTLAVATARAEAGGGGVGGSSGGGVGGGDDSKPSGGAAGGGEDTTGTGDEGPPQDLVPETKGEVVARGRTSEEEGHSHAYVVLRDGPRLRVVTSPAGSDAHKHPDELLRSRAGTVKEILDPVPGGDGHTHRVAFKVPESRRARKVKRFANAILAMRAAINEELEESKDDFFSPDAWEREFEDYAKKARAEAEPPKTPEPSSS